MNFFEIIFKSVKITRRGGQGKSYYGDEPISERKTHININTSVLIITVVAHAANVRDSKVAPNVIITLKSRFNLSVKVLADGGNRGELVHKTTAIFSFMLNMV